MDISSIIDKFDNKAEQLLIRNAYDFASCRLRGKYHFSGRPLLDYWLEVVKVLFRFNVDYLTVMCAILYETVNYGADFREIEFIFGKDVRDIIYKLKCINDSEFLGDSASLRTYYDAMDKDYSCDFKTLFIKLGERFHYLELIRDCSDEYKKLVADDTMKVLSPVAQRMRLTYLKSQLDDVCFKYLEPTKYNDILEKLGAGPDELKSNLNSMKKSVSCLLREFKIDGDVKGRVKNIYGIYRKLLLGKEFSDIYDVVAMTVIVYDIFDCYKVFDVISSKYRVIPFRIKDYIVNPKDNMYQALHMCIYGDDGRIYEIQIKTVAMNVRANAKDGHLIYKQRKYGS